MALRAVIFDYGMVLTSPPDPEAHAALARISGLAPERLDALYWAHRDAYDLGSLTGQEFWRKISSEAKLNLSEATIEELNETDARMWTTENRAMIAWQLAVKQHGLLTAIVSNMGDAVLRAMQQKFDWLSRFDVLVWSYQLRMAKPDPAIYHYVLAQLGTRPEETLFIDDRLPNVETARKLGMKALVFTNIDQLRADLIANHFDQELPLP